jgi:hypothetical protein
MKKWAFELNKTFSEEEIQMAKKHMKKCLPSLAIMQMQIKITLRFHLTLVRMGIIKNTTHKQQMLVRMQGKRNPHTLLMRLQVSTTM